MNGAYKPYNGGSRKTFKKRARAYDGRAKDRYVKSVEIRLTVCLAIAAALSVTRLVFPAFFSGVKNEVAEAIGINADIKSAANVIGEAIEGEKSPGEAFTQACAYVFGRGDAVFTGENNGTDEALTV